MLGSLGSPTPDYSNNRINGIRRRIAVRKTNPRLNTDCSHSLIIKGCSKLPLTNMTCFDKGHRLLRCHSTFKDVLLCSRMQCVSAILPNPVMRTRDRAMANIYLALHKDRLQEMSRIPISCASPEVRRIFPVVCGGLRTYVFFLQHLFHGGSSYMTSFSKCVAFESIAGCQIPIRVV